MIVDSIRCWRNARDHGCPVQPALFPELDRMGFGLLAPALDSVLTLFEAVSKRRLRVGRISPACLSEDEHCLLDLLLGRCVAIGLAPNIAVDRGLASILLIALRTTRIVMCQLAGNGPKASGGAAASDYAVAHGE